jgi:hypothetical protein
LFSKVEDENKQNYFICSYYSYIVVGIYSWYDHNQKNILQYKMSCENTQSLEIIRDLIFECNHNSFCTALYLIMIISTVYIPPEDKFK